MNLSHMNGTKWSHENGFVPYEWEFLKRSALKCLFGACTSSKDISVHCGLGCISSNFLLKPNEISVCCGIPTYSEGFWGFGCSIP